MPNKRLGIFVAFSLFLALAAVLGTNDVFAGPTPGWPGWPPVYTGTAP